MKFIDNEQIVNYKWEWSVQEQILKYYISSVI